MSGQDENKNMRSSPLELVRSGELLANQQEFGLLGRWLKVDATQSRHPKFDPPCSPLVM